MSNLGKRKTRLVFTTCDTVRERGKLREVVIEAQPYTAIVRLAGMRKSFEISWAGIYCAAARLAAESARAAKKKGRNGR